jgi:hypothetical protein
MIRQLACRAVVAAVPLIGLPVLVLAAAPGTALASVPSPSISFHGQKIQLQPDGSVDVTVDYSCIYGTVGPSTVIVTVVQPAVTATNSTGNINCDGQKHTVTVDVLGTRPFTPGNASVTATVQSDDRHHTLGASVGPLTLQIQ